MSGKLVVVDYTLTRLKLVRPLLLADKYDVIRLPLTVCRCTHCDIDIVLTCHSDTIRCGTSSQ